jgi:hypothetical protein
MNTTEQTKKVKANDLITYYPKELIHSHIGSISGYSALDNVLHISETLMEYVTGSDSVENEVKEKYYCIYSYLKFNLNLMEEIIRNDKN